MSARSVACAIGALLFVAGCVAQPSRAWRSLTPNDSLDAWIPKVVGHAAGRDPLHTFRIKGGVISVRYNEYGENLQGRIAHLYTRQPYRAYRLSLDYRFVGVELPNTPLAKHPVNSGVMFHSQSAQQMGLNQPYPVSIEAQLLGPHPEGERRFTGNFCERAMKTYLGDELLPHCISSTVATQPKGKWVHLELEVLPEGRVREYIDGRLIIQVDRVELNPAAMDARLPVKDVVADAGGDLRRYGGHIALQSEGSPIDFRNIRIRSLE